MIDARADATTHNKQDVGYFAFWKYERGKKQSYSLGLFEE